METTRAVFASVLHTIDRCKQNHSSLLDHILARTGYDSQLRRLGRPNRPDNLWQPVPGDHGAQGAFDAPARNWSPQLWISEHRGWLTTAVVALAISGLVAFFKNKCSRP